ncbi:MAG: glycine cleavage system aminomethyltransferase GcvT [Chloroflexi bacterium]|nr:glycine cleavage system aminomethyltransferase GcvT [Chloroflexota bacterium]
MVTHLQRSPLHASHLAHGARMVPFAAWELPLQFAGIIAEVRAVRSASGLFDVSHMGRLGVRGPQAAGLLDWALTAPIPSLAVGRARYTLACSTDGGILDDAVVYRSGPEEYLLVCNAANRDTVWRWLLRWQTERFGDAALEDRTLDTAMVALQGPQAPALLERLASGVAGGLTSFGCAQAQVLGWPTVVSRTGYTGEDGFELILAAEGAPRLWERLVEMGAAPCGLGARDLLRLEAGLLLHGADMDSAANPFEAGLERFVALDKESAASAALRRIRQEGVRRKLTGFQMVERGIPRHGYAIVHLGAAVGTVTSGGYSPTLDRSVGLGYVPVELAQPGTRFAVDVRGRLVEAQAVSLPFYSRRRK